MELKGSWKTNMGGVGIILTAVTYIIKQLTDGDPATSIDFTVIMAAVAAAWTAFKSRDDDKTSEDVGAK